ncbi:MAG: PQQ-binding-like beta-propeller repeat protein [Pirellulaceae bacterium]|nr:PQQ-binding-like beta-propeller repeat protein [Pirellulaceae bacterium]
MNTLQQTICAGLLCITLALQLSLACAEDSLQWRGTDGQGHSKATNLPVTWSETSNVAWKTEIPGRGWSTPVISGNQIWLTTAIETVAKPEDAEKRLKTNTGDQPLTLLERVELRAVCVDRESGRILQNVLLIDKQSPQWVHKLNSYASPSPVLEGQRLFCHFGSYGSACLNTANGKVVWTNTELEVMHENGPGGSPIVIGDLVIMHMDGSDKQFIAAVDKYTGQLRWRTDRSGEMHANPQLRKSYGTPIVMTIAGQTQIVSPASDWLYGYEPETGKELWKMPYGELGFSLTPRPVVGNGRLYMATGFGRSQMLAVQMDQGEPKILWRYKQGIPTMPSPILIGNELYFVNDSGGILTCLDATSGEEIYRQRLGGNFSSSPMAAEGRIYLGNRDGSVFVIQAGREYKLLSENKLPGALYATPVAIENSLYLRTDLALYRLEN